MAGAGRRYRGEGKREGGKRLSVAIPPDKGRIVPRDLSSSTVGGAIQNFLDEHSIKRS